MNRPASGGLAGGQTTVTALASLADPCWFYRQPAYPKRRVWPGRTAWLTGL
jgi:hypothetical protein